MDPRRPATGYLALPDGSSGPGILVLHAWWGLTSHVKEVCDRLAGQGFVALAPDLFAGRLVSDIDQAERHLGEVDADELARLTRASLQTLRQLPATSAGPVGLLGFSMGASMALWLAARVPEAVRATAVFYGSQEIDMADARSAFLGHFAEVDPYVDEDGVTVLEAELHLDGRDVTFHRYPGTRHWFAEDDRPEHDPEAARLAWDRTLSFFQERLCL